MSTGTLLMVLIWGFVAFITIPCFLVMHYAEDIERWRDEKLQPWLKNRGLLK